MKTLTIHFFVLTILVLVSTTSYAQTMMKGSASDIGLMVNGTIQASATSAGNLIVRSDPTAANHVATKNYHDSNTPAETDPQVNAVTSGQWCRGTGSQVTCDRSAPVTSETDPQVSAVTNGQWCRGTGSQVTCDQAAPSSGIPSGAVLPFDLASCPSGWTAFASAQDRFIVGSGSSYARGATGGAATVALTVNEMPSHNHSTTFEIGYTNGSEPASMAKNKGSKKTVYSNNTGGGAAHENRPPYLALLYCKKD